MPEYVNRPDRKVGKSPKSIVKYFAKLKQQGLSQREITSRFGIPKSTVGDYLRGKSSPSSKRAAELAQTINHRNEEQSFFVTLPNQRGKLVTLEPIQKADRAKVRSYREEIQKMVNGKEYDLSPFKGKSITVRGKKRKEKFELITDDDILKKMAEQGQMSEMKFFRNKGS